ncbi:MAG: TVP38/TMEM64 family protein [Gammaproteobacteria bacterium]
MNKQSIKNLFPAGRKLNAGLLALCCLIALLFIFGAPYWLNLDTLKNNQQALLGYVESHYWTAMLACGLVYAVTTALSVPGATVLSLAVGFLFGRWVGTLLIVVSATVGATLIFWLARYLLSDWARERVQSHPTAARLMANFESDAMNYLLFLRLVPLFPFWLVNLAPAFTPVSSRTYVLSTFIGIIPGSFVYANLGQSLGRIDSLENLISFEAMISLLLLGLLSLAPVLVKKTAANTPEDRA